MSIIQEALKKAEERSKPQAAVPKTEESLPELAVIKDRPILKVKPSPKKAKAVMPLIPVLAPVALAAMAIAAFFIFKNVYHARPAEAPAPKEVSSRQEVVRKDAAPVPAEKPSLFPIRNDQAEPPKFILSGIMYLEAGPKAIVNGSVIREGDLINGATVKKINPGEVLLDYRDMEIQLNLND